MQGKKRIEFKEEL